MFELALSSTDVYNSPTKTTTIGMRQSFDVFLYVCMSDSNKSIRVEANAVMFVNRRDFYAVDEATSASHFFQAAIPYVHRWV
jgi:hypothetical protein